MLYIGIAMALLLFRTIVVRACQHKPKAANNAQPERIATNIAALQALQEQRDIYNDLIENLDYQLNNAPQNRDRLLKDKAAILARLATCESKITKLIK